MSWETRRGEETAWREPAGRRLVFALLSRPFHSSLSSPPFEDPRPDQIARSSCAPRSLVTLARDREKSRDRRRTAGTSHGQQGERSSLLIRRTVAGSALSSRWRLIISLRRVNSFICAGDSNGRRLEEGLESGPSGGWIIKCSNGRERLDVRVGALQLCN